MKRLSKNIISLLFSDLFRRLVGFLAVAYLARKVGVDGFGIVNIAFAVLSYSILLSSMGLNTFGMREIARGTDTSIVSVIVSFKLFSAVIIYFLVLTFTQLFIKDIMTKNLISLLCISTIANSILLDWYYQGKERMVIVSLVRVLSAVIYLVIIIIFVRSKDDLVWVGIGAITADTISSIVMYFYFQAENRAIRLNWDLKSWLQIFNKSLPFSIGNIFANLSMNLAPLIVGIILTNANVGIFSAANKLVFFLLILDRVFGSLLLPASSRLYANSAEKLSNVLNISVKLIVFISLPIAVGGTILANKIIIIVFGQNYHDAVIVFQVLIWYFLITLLHTVYTSTLLSVGQEKYYGKVMVLNFFVYLISIFLFTSFLSEVGTAIAIVFSELITLLLFRLRLKPILEISFVPNIIKIVPALIIMSIFLVIFKELNVFILILGGCLVYLLVIFLLRVITNQEIEEVLKRIW